MLLGFVNYESGQEFLMGGELVEITEDNKDYFQRVLRIGIPLTVALVNTKESVIQFLLNLNSAVMEEPVDESPPIKIKPDTNEEMEFDLDELTDEQKLALDMFDKAGKLN